MQFWSATPQLQMVARLTQPWTPARRISDHSHAFHELALVLEGECAWRLGRRRLDLKAGELLLLPPHRRHREEVPPGGSARILWIGFRLATEPENFSLLFERARPAGPWAEDVAALGNMLYREHQSPELPGSADRVESLLRALFVTLARIAGGADDTADDGRHAAALRAAAHTLRRNLAAPLKLAALARYHGLTPGHFTALFHATHGLPPRAFLREARLAEARRLLRETREPVKSIATACGFGDAAHFCRQFKRTVGQTPRSWRLAAAEGLPA